ncbi:MAG: hypothetical protein K9J12_18730 [Melioribacteraceae bacterium]|nr:hypothetical protein [Melioribacteraceae bacterium]MCF8264682.1 hypothetical protein [Melioribacteraceae bacterium]MCF8431590.1 hypothetical protein [Melioribacteraceae bacterium]
MNDNTDLTYLKIFKFWLPLAATWLMMSVEGPFISAIIARMPDEKFNLAAYGVAFSFALIIEAPIIMLMSASTALAKNYKSFLKLRKFTYVSNFTITFVMLIFLFPPIFDFVIKDLVGLIDEVAKLTYTGLLILIPWPGMIGYRRFYQGVLIRNDQTKKVAYGTVLRLTAMLITSLSFFLLTDVAGIIVGASALTAGVTVEGLATKFMANKVIATIKENSNVIDKDLSFKQIYHFYYPLALMSMISLAVHPVVTFFLGKSFLALESLAILPVINSLVFIFRSLGLSYHEVVVALIGENFEGFEKLKKFGLATGFLIIFLLGLIAFTPLSYIWMHVVSGLSIELSNLTAAPLMVIFILPGLTFLISFQRAILVVGGDTSPITLATVIEVSGIIAALFLAINYFNLFGATAATLAYVFGRILANMYLVKPNLTVLRRFNL